MPKQLLRILLRPQRSYAVRVTERADAEAIAAGLTVEVLPGGVRHYRDPRLDQLAAHRVCRSRDAQKVSVPAAEPTAPENRIVGRRSEHGGPSLTGGAGAVPAPTVPPQGRFGFASASHATALRRPLTRDTQQRR